MITRFIKFLLIAAWNCSCLLAGWICLRLGKTKLRDRVSCRCHAVTLRLAGVRLMVQGSPATARPLLVASNHLSYLDIPILGSVFPFRFVAKQEIAGWPGIGALCRVSGVIFVERKTEKLSESAGAIERNLAAGEAVCFFPEGTTGTGLKPLPFKSSFFNLAETGVNGRELTVQPVAVVYTRIRRLPIDSCQWPQIAWYGDMELVPHAWRLLGLGQIEARLVFLPPATIEGFEDRKHLAAHCEDAISQAIEHARANA